MSEQYHLTTKDYIVLQTMLERSQEAGGPYAELLAHRVRHSAVCLREDIPEDVVTLNTRLVYTLDGRPVPPQLVVQAPNDDLPAFALSIHTIRGLALLGMRVGAVCRYRVGASITETVRVAEILSQPEAEARRKDHAAAHGAAGNVVPLRRRAETRLPVFVDDDDPGPSAA